MRASEARQGCMAPMVSKSTPSSSPAALRSRSQRIVARSEAGCAMRATTEPSAASRSAALTPSDSSRAGRPSSPGAHSAACSTPTERGRASARLSTATASTPPAASSAGAAPRASSCAAMRCASVSTASGTSPNSRPGRRGRPRRAGTAAARGRGRRRSGGRGLSSVRWRTRPPSRSERTRRWVWQTAPPSVARVLVRRTNMGGTMAAAEVPCKACGQNYGTTFASRELVLNEINHLRKRNCRKSTDSAEKRRQIGKVGLMVRRVHRKRACRLCREGRMPSLQRQSSSDASVSAKRGYSSK